VERYEEALEVSRQLEERVRPGSRMDATTKVYFSWIYQELGRGEEARAYMEEALKIKPDYSLENWTNEPYKDPAHLKRMLDAFRKAGMPEKPPGAIQEKPSIAVLPFDDLSPEKDQEYFVLGLSEEILNYISNISGLHVTSKTSSFAFKGTNKTIKEIAEILERDYILEGSVRKAGDSLRITTQLIDVADDRHLWSETYDRELKDIFKIQEDIANSVADKLELTLDAFQLLGGTESVEAYESYLVAKGQYYDFENSQALKSIDKAIALDPSFALGWSLKSQIHIELTFVSSPDRVSLGQGEALKAARKAIELEPGMGQAYLALGSIHYYMNEFIESELAYQQGMGLITESINSYGYSFETHYAGIGYLRKAYELFEERMLNNTPDPPAHAAYMLISGYLGNNERAEEEYERGKAIFGDQWDYGHGYITNVRLGARKNLSVDEIPELPLFDPIWSIARENIEDPENGLAELQRLYIGSENLSAADLLNISLFSAYFGDPEFSIKVMEKNVNLSNSGMMFFWAPVFREVRQLPRFKELIREIGLVDYWKKYGWPDTNICHPVGDDDFECD
jgi:adenylate cyclase